MITEIKSLILEEILVTINPPDGGEDDTDFDDWPSYARLMGQQTVWSALNNSPFYTSLFAYSGRKLVGALSYYKEPSPEYDWDSLYISSVASINFVGLKALFKEVLRRASALGYGILHEPTYQPEFYKRIGMHQKGRFFYWSPSEVKKMAQRFT